MNIRNLFIKENKDIDVNEHADNINKLIVKITNDTEFSNSNPFAFMTFTNMIFYFIEAKFPNEKDSIIYKKANINAKHFNKIKNDKYHPSKKTAIALGLALHLNIEEFEALLTSASYALSLNNVFDVVIMYCINNKIYDLIIVNEILYEFNLPLL